MKSIPRRTIEKSLSDKGFEVDDRRDHRFYYFTYQGRRTPIRTKISTGTGYRDYDAGLLHLMQRQLKLSFKDICDLLLCPMSRETYQDRLRQAGHIR